MWRIFIPNGEACVPVGAIDSEEIGPDWRLASSEKTPRQDPGGRMTDPREADVNAVRLWLTVRADEKGIE